MTDRIDKITAALPIMVRVASRLDSGHAHDLFVADAYRLSVRIAEWQLAEDEDPKRRGRFEAVRALEKNYRTLARTLTLLREAGL